MGIDLLLKDGIIDDTVKASFRVALHIDMEEGEVLECNIYSESDALPERDMWLLSNYLVPILRKDGIEAGSEELHGKYYPEALCDLKVHNAFVMAERMGLRVMTLPLHKRPRTKSILFFCESEITICANQAEAFIAIPEVIRAIEEQTEGLVSRQTFRPSGCENATCSFHGNFVLMPDGSLQSWTHHRAQSRCCCQPEPAEAGAAVARGAAATCSCSTWARGCASTTSPGA